MGRIQLFAYSLVLGLTACGGGGDGGGGGSAGGSGTTPPPPQTPLGYFGATTAATIGATNAGTVTANVVGATGATIGGPVVAVSARAESAPASEPQPTGATGLPRRLAQAMHGSDLAAGPVAGVLAGVAVDQTVPCDSGSMRISGDRAANGTGTLSVSYNACRTGSDTINGPASLQINSYDALNRVIADGIFSFTRVSFTGPGIDSDLTGTLRKQAVATPNFMDGGAATETVTLNTVTQDKGTGRMTRTQDLRIVNVYSSMTAPTFYNQSIDGRVYDSVAGYVDVTTNTMPFKAPWGPLYYSTTGQSFPDWGEIVLTGATGSRIRVTALAIDLAKIEVDADGNGVYENSARLQWSQLNSPLAADLGDSDGDGMHNSWETANGLNPLDPSDANADLDGDGATNRTEYLAGSDAGTSGSIPGTVRKVWVTNVRELDADPSGTVFVYVNSGEAVPLDTVTGELARVSAPRADPVPSHRDDLTVTDVALNRTFSLAPSAAPGAGPTMWTLSVTDAPTGAPLWSLDVSLAGTNPGNLIRYGAKGIAFRTIGTASPGYVYLVESPAVIP